MDNNPRLQMLVLLFAAGGIIAIFWLNSNISNSFQQASAALDIFPTPADTEDKK